MEDIVNKKVLVLDAGFMPINTVSIKTVIKLMYSRQENNPTSVQIVDSEYNSYTWNEWISYSNLIENQGLTFIRSVRLKILVPNVIRLANCCMMQKDFNVHPTRDSVFRRDEYQCQYCGVEVNKKIGTIDHVIPRSRREDFGMSLEFFNSWENIVVACSKCNSKKSNKTLKESGMCLSRRPTKFKWKNYFIDYNREDWTPFINRCN